MVFPVVEASNFGLLLNDVAVLEDAEFKLHEGQWHEITGKPNAGKSTILKSFMGQYYQCTGHLKVLGYSLFPLNREDARILRRKIGFVHQLPMLLMDKTIRVNLNMALQAAERVSSEPDDQIIIQMLKEVGLAEKLITPIQDLSFTEITIINVLRSLMIKPKLLIIDQVLEYLASDYRSKIVAMIHDAMNKDKICVLSTSYNALPDLPFDTIKFKLESGKLLSIK
ncbi:MAG: ATP-binding cassette domain-containing protein [Saprospiraceae bacterium]|nr:ATP-binding cassette domain-containing protein [Saprospiraceae bacterium]